MVRDTGCGMPPDVLRQIFDPFYSTKSGPDASGKGGTGLGLSMCRDIIEAHHGRIRVDSTPGRGTAFTIKLPAVVAVPKVSAGVIAGATAGLSSSASLGATGSASAAIISNASLDAIAESSLGATAGLPSRVPATH